MSTQVTCTRSCPLCFVLARWVHRTLTVRQLYQFLKQANQLRYTPIRNIESQEKFIRFAEMPSHPTLQIQRPIRVDEETQETPEFLVRVRRPLQTPCPTPPQPLQKWLLSGWDDPTKSVSTAQSLNVVTEVLFKDDSQRVQDLRDFSESRRLGDNSPINPPTSIAAWLKDGWEEKGSVPEVYERREITETVRFSDDPERVASYQSWIEQRSGWVEPELAARRAMAFYERIYDLYVTLEKDGENLELVVGDGRLQWRAVSEGATREPVPVEIDHPILLKRVELRFSPEVPEFVIAETDREPELYSSILSTCTTSWPLQFEIVAMSSIKPDITHSDGMTQQDFCAPLCRRSRRPRGSTLNHRQKLGWVIPHACIATPCSSCEREA